MCNFFYQFSEAFDWFKHVEYIWMIVEQFSNKRGSGSVSCINDKLIPYWITGSTLFSGFHAIFFLLKVKKKAGSYLFHATSDQPVGPSVSFNILE